jgi:hypothetical protein
LAATRGIEVIGRWWTDWPQANIGTNAGRAGERGVVFIDLDPRNLGNLQKLRTLASLDEQDINTPTFITGGGGRQLTYDAEGRDFVASNMLIEAPGIDIRAGDTYSILPPSLHISGRRYQWLEGKAWGEIPLQPLPEGLLPLLKVREPNTEPELIPDPPSDLLSTPNLHPWVAGALKDSLDKIHNAREGTRNTLLHNNSFGLYQIALAHEAILPESELFKLLFNAGVSIGLDETEIIKTLASARAGAMKKPRRVWPELKVGKSYRKKGCNVMEKNVETTHPPDAPPVADPLPAENVTELFAQLNEAGVSLRLEGDTILASPGRAVTGVIAQGIRHHKDELLLVLRARNKSVSTEPTDTNADSHDKGQLGLPGVDGAEPAPE